MKQSHIDNIYLNPVRNYRKIESSHVDEQKFQVMVEETDLLISIPKFVNMEEAGDKCFKYISLLRQELKNHIQVNPSFQHSLKPITVPKDTPSIIKAMCHAARYANVGPFAAVAGSVAQLTCQMLVTWITQEQEKKIECIRKQFIKQELEKEQGTRQNLEKKSSEFLRLDEKLEPINVIVENGGDIYLYSQKERVVGILTNPKEGESIGIKINQDDFPVSICSSSSKIGHSLSFGNGDIAMVRAKNAALADALATAYCNMLKTSKDINKVIEQAQKDAEIKIPHNPFDNGEIIVFLKNQDGSIQRKQSEHIKIFEHNAPTKNHQIENHQVENHQIENNFHEHHLLGGLEGVFVQCDGHIGAWGKIELVAL